MHSGNPAAIIRIDQKQNPRLRAGGLYRCRAPTRNSSIDEGPAKLTEDNIRARAESRKKIHSRAAKKAIDTDKIAKLVRMLASDRDGEVLAAVSALKRALGAGGADINDMSHAVAAGLKPRAPAKPNWGPQDPDLDYWQSMAWFCHANALHLRDHDRDYVHDVLLGRHFDDGRADATMMRRLRGIVATVKAARSAEDAW
jgi:hypothetical protein